MLLSALSFYADKFIFRFFLDNSPAKLDSLPICAANVKRSRQAERSTAFFPLSNESARMSTESTHDTSCFALSTRINMGVWNPARALHSDFVVACQRSWPLGIREHSSRYHRYRYILLFCWRQLSSFQQVWLTFIHSICRNTCTKKKEPAKPALTVRKYAILHYFYFSARSAPLRYTLLQ